jgi:RNA polymerase sigma factor (sigma-70 family)
LRYLHHFSPPAQGVAPADLEDIAAQKSLDLLRKSEQGEWDPTGRSPGEITNFLATVARNGLLDFVRKDKRHVRPDSDAEPVWETREFNSRGQASQGVSPSLQVERREFVEGLRECADELQARSRRVWFFRVFLEMSSKEIAAHPEVMLKPGHVDVILQRAREAIRDCMARKGFDAQDIPPGTFSELWRVWRAESVTTFDA